MRFLAGVVLVVVVALTGASNAPAATTFTVTRTDDPTPNGCDSDCSLREAVLASNAGAGGDTIVLPAGHYRLGIAGAGEDAAATGDLDLTKSVTITGAGARSTVIDAMGTDRVLDVQTGVTALISDVTIAGGQVAGDGAGVRNAGTLTLVRDAIVRNHASGAGGAIESTGPALTVTQSTIAGNEANGNGGGVDFLNSLTVADSTISANVAGSPAANGYGGGIEGGGGATLMIRSATVSGNQAFNPLKSAAGLDSTGTAQNTIVAHNVAYLNDQSAAAESNCGVSPTSLGNNLSDTAACGFTQATDHQGAPVLLAPLADNGGPTDTEALPAGSPAVDAGAGCPATDQRGVTRPRGSACDIGAYEVAPPVVATGAASAISFTGAVLTGTVDPSLRETTATFDYGTTTAYGSTLPLGIVGSGSGAVQVTAALSGLRQGVTYHFRLVAANAEGTTVGADQSFTTLDKTPPVLSLLRVLPGLFHRANGATLSLRLSERATVTFRIDHVLTGTKRKGSCVVRGKRSRGRTCTYYLPVPGSFTQAGVAGTNEFHFDATVGGRQLLPGAYRLRASPRDTAGNLGKTVVTAFRVLR
ncbi:MAG: CSLREA domain-containing protein [Gaiellaceae bacterium]